MTRDPRTDPREKDKLYKMRGKDRTITTREVTKRGPKDGRIVVEFIRNGVYTGHCFLESWQSWSRDAEIVRVGE